MFVFDQKETQTKAKRWEEGQLTISLCHLRRSGEHLGEHLRCCTVRGSAGGGPRFCQGIGSPRDAQVE